MKSLLFLCHRLPYPPDKGDKIRSYHVVTALAQRFRVYLGTFIDAEEDWRHVEHVRGLVTELEVRSLARNSASVRSSVGLLTGGSLSVHYYANKSLARWVRTTLARRDIDYVYVYSSAMGQFLPTSGVPLSIMDFCDLDSEKWAQYGLSRNWPLSWVYRRESQLLQRVEKELARRSNWSLFVTDAESDHFRSTVPGLADRVVTMRNGVDTEYFDPDTEIPAAGKREPTVVFTGAMDYWANIDAMKWFVGEVWPIVLASQPAAKFVIVGSRPADAVKRLTQTPGVSVTGTVPDVRPYLTKASVVVAPLRIARGIQNKVLEALAMARPVVATPAALEGLDEGRPPCLVCASTPQEFASAVVARLSPHQRAIPDESARAFVMARYSWKAALQPLWKILGDSTNRVGELLAPRISPKNIRRIDEFSVESP